MAKHQFSINDHPLYPDEWFGLSTAGHLLYKHNLPTRITKTRCKRDGLEISGDGLYIRRLSLEHYIQREEAERAQQ